MFLWTEYTIVGHMVNIIEENPKVLGGSPVIKGTRIPVARVLALVGMGYTLTKLKKEFPDLSRLTKKDLHQLFSYYQNKFSY